jgi:hypothetical protein
MSQNQQAIGLTQKAHAAELERDFKQAREFYSQALPLLDQVVASGEKKSEERRRAKLHLKATKERLQLLGIGEVANTPSPLPSITTFQMEANNPGDVVLLSLVSVISAQNTEAHE